MNCVEDGQGDTGCTNEAVLLVDIGPLAVAGTATSTTGETFGTSVEIPEQRLGYCVAHGTKHGLAAAVTVAELVRDRQAEPFPKDHALAADWTWRPSDV